MNKRIAVLGDGAWGTAIATVLAYNGYTVHLWCYNDAVRLDIITNRCNSQYLPEVKLSKNIIPLTDLAAVFDGVDTIFEAIPVVYLRSVLELTKKFYRSEQLWVVLSKGIEVDTLLLPTQMLNDVFSVNVKSVIVSGPSFAYELARQRPTAVVAAACNDMVAGYVKNMLANSFFNIETSLDVSGVALCCAYKNVIALIAGYLEGAGLGANLQAWAITQGLAEMATLVQHCGGNLPTVYGLSGLGDLLLTATSQRSKNRICGILLGKGKRLNEICAATKNLPEGVNTVQSVHALMDRYNLSLPLCSAIYRILFENGITDDIIQGVYTIK